MGFLGLINTFFNFQAVVTSFVNCEVCELRNGARRNWHNLSEFILKRLRLLQIRFTAKNAIIISFQRDFVDMIVKMPLLAQPQHQ